MRRWLGRWVRELGDDVLDAADELADVVGLDRREARHAQLVAAQLAVGLDVDDAVGAQDLGDRGGVDRVVDVDRRDDLRPVRR